MERHCREGSFEAEINRAQNGKEVYSRQKEQLANQAKEQFKILEAGENWVS